MTRCGKLVKASKDSYSRVYAEDGSYTYPQLPANQLRKKGEMYFENWEITGSKKESNGDQKFSLTEWVANRQFSFPSQLSYGQKQKKFKMSIPTALLA